MIIRSTVWFHPQSNESDAATVRLVNPKYNQQRFVVKHRYARLAEAKAGPMRMIRGAAIVCADLGSPDDLVRQQTEVVVGRPGQRQPNADRRLAG